ncbi:four helix bundle protein [Rhodohalobacter mucosus]|uniref:Four helix bundle protein n=1 Tax=Rhodohalobacter mucosus TaxID=2079485 RepID=A0A316TTM9_9BACT|nr:four helix bundle protein [Rhodohalobacter mucosus]PWN07943.1 four helix bundle protein [Rhodohalobacter mucosus]
MLDLKHKNLRVYRESIQLTKLIYLTTEHFPNHEKYGLTNQMRRAAISISSNLSEGSARKSKNERIRFYEIARSSLVELDAQIETVIELEYLRRDELEELNEKINYVFALISRFMYTQ